MIDNAPQTLTQSLPRTPHDPADGPADRPIHAIIPAGGAGTRLWPLSRRGRPKFLLDLTGAGRTLIQGTAARLAPVAATTTVVTGIAHVAAVADQLPDLPRESILAEPAPRDSMAAIALAATVIAARHGRDAVVGSFAADQTIADEAAFADAVRQAAALARAGWVVTIGIEAIGPSTAFGYIHSGGAVGVAGAPDGRRVLGFTEKPDAATATAYLAAGDYRWNAGMFVTRAGVLLDHLAVRRPDLAAGIGAIGVVVLVPVLAVFARRLSVMEMGDDQAEGLGVATERTRLVVMLVGVVLAASAVAAAGPIAFVALAAPQITRRLTGVAGVQVLASALVGSLLLVVADLVSVNLPSRLAVPVGLVTGVIGGLYLLWVLSAKEDV